MRLTEEVNALLFEQADAWFSSEEDPEGELRTALANIATLYGEHSVLLRAIVEVSTYDEEVAVFWRSTLGRFVDATRRRIEEEQAAGRTDVTSAQADGVRAHLDDRAHALPAARPGRPDEAGGARRGAHRDLGARRLRQRVSAARPAPVLGLIASNSPGLEALLDVGVDLALGHRRAARGAAGSLAGGGT